MTENKEVEYPFLSEQVNKVEPVIIRQRVIRVSNPHLLSLGIPHTEQRGNTQNLNMAESLMKAMELHSPSPVFQLCWMNYPIDNETKASTDLVFVRIPFNIDTSTASVLIRLQTDSGMGNKLQSTIVEKLANNPTQTETARQLLAPSPSSKIDLPKTSATHCISIAQSVFDLSKTAYLYNNPRRTYEVIKLLLQPSGGVMSNGTGSLLVPLDEYVSKSKFFRDDPKNE